LRIDVNGPAVPGPYGPGRAAPCPARGPDLFERLTPTEQHDSNATVTALATFALCPRKYYLSQYLGREGRPSPGRTAAEGPSASEFGTQVHALLAGQTIPEPDPEAVRLAEGFHRTALGRRAARATHVEREFDFLMAVEDLVVRGQIDLWFEDAAGIVIVDYKTDAVDAETALHRATDYGLQLRLYAMAVERLTACAPRAAYVHFLRPNAAVPIDLSPSLVDSPEYIIQGFQEAQSSLEFPLNEGSHCRRCPFHKDLCPAGGA
jgi:ATP-dependent helicase/nuclease subunit A